MIQGNTTSDSTELSDAQIAGLFAMNVSVSALSFISAAMILILYLVLWRVRSFALRLVVYLAISDMITYVGFFFGGKKSSSSVFCYIQSLILLWSRVSSILWVTAMAFSMFYAYVLNRAPSPKTSKFYHLTLEKLLNVVCWILPLIWIPIGMGLRHSGPTNAYCYVDMENMNWEYLYLYGMLWLCLIANAVMYVASVIGRIRMNARLRKSEELRQQKEIKDKEAQIQRNLALRKDRSPSRRRDSSLVDFVRLSEATNAARRHSAVNTTKVELTDTKTEENPTFPQVMPNVPRKKSVHVPDEFTSLSADDTLATATETHNELEYEANDYNANAYTENIQDHEDASLYHLRYYLIVLLVIYFIPSINRIVDTANGRGDSVYWLSILSLLFARLGGVLNLVVYISNYTVIYPEMKRILSTINMRIQWRKTGAATIKAAEDAKSTVENMAKRAMGKEIEVREDETEFDLEDDSSTWTATSATVNSVVLDHLDHIEITTITPANTHQEDEVDPYREE